MFSKVSKFLLILLLLLANASSNAYARFHGLYAGAHLGGFLLKGLHKYTNATSKEGVIQLNTVTYIAGLQGGYMYYFIESKIVAGAEFGFSIPGLNITKNLLTEGGPLEGLVTIRHRYKMGLSLFCGIAMNPKAMIYAKVGIENNRFDLNYSQLTFQTPNHEKYNVSLKGLVPGLGIYYKLSPTVLIGGEYNYSFMKKIKLKSDTKTVDGGNRSYSFSPIQHRVVAKIVRLF